jgi:hypothetical protein
MLSARTLPHEEQEGQRRGSIPREKGGRIGLPNASPRRRLYHFHWARSDHFIQATKVFSMRLAIQ